jgi:hypothetical protein
MLLQALPPLLFSMLKQVVRPVGKVLSLSILRCSHDQAAVFAST